METTDLVERPDAAIEQLANHQEQLDFDGVMVGVSRQALDEVLAYVAALQARVSKLVRALEGAAVLFEDLGRTDLANKILDALAEGGPHK